VIRSIYKSFSNTESTHTFVAAAFERNGVGIEQTQQSAENSSLGRSAGHAHDRESKGGSRSAPRLTGIVVY